MTFCGHLRDEKAFLLGGHPQMQRFFLMAPVCKLMPVINPLVQNELAETCHSLTLWHVILV